MKQLLTTLLLSGLCLGQVTNYNRTLSGVNYQTGTTYSLQPIDTTRLTSFANAGAVAVCLSAPASACTGVTQPYFFGAGSIFSVVNTGAGTVTITCSTCTINGAATLVLTTGQGADIYGDGANFAAQQGVGVGSGGSPTFTNLTVTGTCTGCAKSFATVGQGGFIGAGFPFPYAYYAGTTLGGAVVGSTANQVNVYQFQLLASYTISKVSVRVVTGVAASTMNFGVYSAAGAKLLDSGAISTATSSSNQSVTLGTPVTLPPGVYYYAQSCTSTASTVLSLPLGIPASTPNLMNLNAVRVGQAANVTAGGVLPATLGTISADTVFAGVAAVFFEV